MFDTTDRLNLQQDWFLEEIANWNGIDDAGDDTTATVLYTLADHHATVIALTDAIGRVVAQYGYTPYGDLLAAELFANGSDSLAIESLAAARGNRLGHQGLRTERFDRPWDGPMDIASAVTGGTGATGRYRSLCHNRNRLYDPAEGRFTGVDPNGLGVPVLDGLAFGGRAISAGDVAPDLMGHYGDGMNAHVAYAAMPRGVRDPSGLMIGSVIEGMYEELMGTYIQNLDWDVGWATNWDLPDDAHSRTDSSWVENALFIGAIRGAMGGELPEEFEEAWDYFTTADPPEMGGGSMEMAGFSNRAGRGGGAAGNLRIAGRAIAGRARSVPVMGFEIPTFKTKINNRSVTLVEFPPGVVKKATFIRPTGTRNGDARAADRAAGYSATNPRPPNHDWHHGNKRGKMLLIPREIHQHPKLRHAGGWAIWGRFANAS